MHTLNIIKRKKNFLLFFNKNKNLFLFKTFKNILIYFIPDILSYKWRIN